MTLKPTLVRCGPALLTFGLAPASSLLAQPVAPPDSGTPRDDTVVLSEFRVDSTRDRGYVATNATTGTLLNTPLRDTPFGINVFTSQFIEDLGATNFREVLAYDTSTVLDNTITQGFDTGGLEGGDNIENAETDVKVRGFAVPTLTNGFRTQVLVDTIAIQRIERAGGPSSLLYGIGAMSGVTNNITKLPMERPMHHVSVGVGNYGFLRAEFDTTAPLSETLGYRIFGAWTEDESQEEFYQERRQFLGGVLNYRPFESTEIVFDVNGSWRRQDGIGPNDLAFAGMTDPVTGRTASYLRDVFQQGRHVNLGGPDDYSDYMSLTYRGEIIQKIGDHFTLLIAGQREDYEQDRRSIQNLELRSGTTNQVQYAWNFHETDRSVDQFRANLLTKFELLGSHALVVGRQEYSENVQLDVSEPWFRNYPTSSIFPELNTRPDGTNPMLGYGTLGPDFRIRYNNEPYVPVSKVRTLEQWISGNYVIHQGKFWEERINTVLGYRWERTHNLRLETVAPNHYNTRAQNDRIWPRRNASDPDQGGTVLDPLVSRNTTVDGYANEGKPMTGGYPTAGLSFRITPALSIYGQYAEALSLPKTAQGDGFGNGFPPEELKSEEIGIKFDFQDGRISGRLTAFRSERLNAVRYGFSLPAPARGTFNPSQPVTFNISAGVANNPAGTVALEQRTYFWDNTADRQALIAWHDADRQRGGGGLGFAGGNNGHGNRGAYANYDEESEGFEMEINLNPLRGWSIRGSYTYNDVIVAKGISNLADQDFEGGFFSPLHPAFTTLGESNFTNGPTVGDLSSYTTDVRTSSFVDNQYGNFKKSDTPTHSATIWNKYEFQGDRLKGFAVGGGVRYQSERTTDFAHGRNDRPQAGVEDRSSAAERFVRPPVPESWLFDLFLGYNRRIGERDWSFQLNVRNLLDNQKLERIGLPPEGSGLTVPRTATLYLDPRDIRFTATVRF